MTAAPHSARSFSFLAQSLDNSTPDTISVRGRVLDTQDLRSPERVQFVDTTTFVSSRGKEIGLEASDARAWVAGDEVIVQLIPPERDASGRLAPILCLGDLRHPRREVWADVLTAELEEFAELIGRQISPRQQSEVHRLAAKIFQSRRPLERIGLRRSPASHQSSVPRVEEPPAERRAGAVSAGLLPTDPVRRRIILVLGEAEMRLYKSRQDLRQILVSDGVAVLRPAPGLEKSEQGELGRKLEKLGLLQSKAVLIQNPYRPDEYLNAGNDPEEAVARAKIQAFLRLCQLLGAARVTAKSVTETEDASSSTFDVSGGAIANIGPVNAAHNQKADSLEKLARKLSYTQENASGQADVLAAREFLRSHGLEWDQDFVYLVETVEAARNPVARLTVRMDTKAATDQIRSRLSKVNASLAQLEGSSRREFHGRAHFSFQAEVIFSKPDSPVLPTHGGVQ